MPALSQKSIRDVVQGTEGITKKQLAAKLTEAEVTFNDPLLDGFLQQALEKWLSVDDKGKYSIRKRASSGGGAPTKLFKIDDAANPAGAKLVEQEYDAKVEEKDEMVSRTALGAIRKAKAYWYNELMVPQREAYRALQAAHTTAKPDTEEEAAA